MESTVSPVTEKETRRRACLLLCETRPVCSPPNYPNYSSNPKSYLFHKSLSTFSIGRTAIVHSCQKLPIFALFCAQPIANWQPTIGHYYPHYPYSSLSLFVPSCLVSTFFICLISSLPRTYYPLSLLLLSARQLSSVLLACCPSLTQISHINLSIRTPRRGLDRLYETSGVAQVRAGRFFCITIPPAGKTSRGHHNFSS